METMAVHWNSCKLWKMQTQMMRDGVSAQPRPGAQDVHEHLFGGRFSYSLQSKHASTAVEVRHWKVAASASEECASDVSIGRECGLVGARPSKCTFLPTRSCDSVLPWRSQSSRASNAVLENGGSMSGRFTRGRSGRKKLGARARDGDGGGHGVGECARPLSSCTRAGRMCREKKQSLLSRDIKRKKRDGVLNSSGSVLHNLRMIATSRPNHAIAASPTAAEAIVQDITRGTEWKYMFHVSGGGVMRAVVNKDQDTCTVVIDFDDTSQLKIDQNSNLFMHWGLFRSDRDEWVVLDQEDSPPDTFPVGINGWSEADAMRTQFARSAEGKLQIQLDLNSSAAPFAIKFALFQSKGDDRSKDTWLRSAKGTDFVVPIGMRPGRVSPLGVSWGSDGSANFALHSAHAEYITLCLYDHASLEPLMELDLDPSLHRTGAIWHIHVDSADSFARYGYRCKGEMTWENGNRFSGLSVLLDPYAVHISPLVKQEEEMALSRSTLGLLVRDEPLFHWGRAPSPRIPMEELVVYKLSIPAFTAKTSSGCSDPLAGTFLGVLEKVDYLKGLGVNAVVLMPVAVHDEKQGPYFPINFFAPMPSYSTDGDPLSASMELKTLVRELHRNDIEVILEVVYSHTAEGSDEEPNNFSLRGIDCSTYYVMDRYGHLVKSDRAGNCLNSDYPPVQSLILESLRHWVVEYHVDGFCFANAGALMIGRHGEHLARPVLVEAIAFDPILADVKLIADSITPDFKALKFPHWKRWAEINRRFGNDVTPFLHGDTGHLSSFATRFYGSGDIFGGGRGPAYGFNCILPLDALGRLVQDQESRDAEDAMPPTATSPDFLKKQMLNCFTALFLSQGIPLLTMGDEYAHLKIRDSALADSDGGFEWDWLETASGQQVIQFITGLISIRKRRSRLFQRKHILHLDDLSWHGREPGKPEWDNPCAFIAATIHSANIERPGAAEDEVEKLLTRIPGEVGDIYIAFNAHKFAVNVGLPDPPSGMEWFRIIDTAAESLGELILNGQKLVQTYSEAEEEECKTDPVVSYKMEPSSCLVLEAQVPIDAAATS